VASPGWRTALWSGAGRNTRWRGPRQGGTAPAPLPRVLLHRCFRGFHPLQYPISPGADSCFAVQGLTSTEAAPAFVWESMPVARQSPCRCYSPVETIGGGRVWASTLVRVFFCGDTARSNYLAGCWMFPAWMGVDGTLWGGMGEMAQIGVSRRGGSASLLQN